MFRFLVKVTGPGGQFTEQVEADDVQHALEQYFNNPSPYDVKDILRVIIKREDF